MKTILFVILSLTLSVPCIAETNVYNSKGATAPKLTKDASKSVGGEYDFGLSFLIGEEVRTKTVGGKKVYHVESKEGWGTQAQFDRYKAIKMQQMGAALGFLGQSLQQAAQNMTPAPQPYHSVTPVQPYQAPEPYKSTASNYKPLTGQTSVVNPRPDVTYYDKHTGRGINTDNNVIYKNEYGKPTSYAPKESPRSVNLTETK